MSASRGRGLTAVLGMVLGLAPAAAAIALEPPPRNAPALPIFGVETTVIAVPVFVTDKNGKAVAGLAATDFEVTDAGKRVDVVAFEAVDTGAASSGLPPAASATVEAATRRQFLLLFDLGFSTPSGLNKSRAAALDFLQKGLAPRDLAAVAVLAAAGPSVLVGFTSDRTQLRQAVVTLGMAGGERLRDPLGLAWDLGVRVQETPGGLEVMGGGGFDRDMFYLQQRSEQEVYRRRVGAYVASLESLARLLDSVRGRKQIVLFSAGFDQSVVSGAEGADRQAANQAVAQGALWEVQSDAYFGDASTRGGLDQLFRRMGAADAVIHTVDVGGLAAGGDVAEATRVSTGRGRDSLAQLAEGTGGMFLREVNDVAAALEDVLDASRYFYVVGFAPPDAGKPGKFRKLSVKVKRAGLKVSHRPGYVVADPAVPTDATVARLSAGDAIAKGLTGGAFALRAVAVPQGAGAGVRLLPVVLQIDGPGLLAGMKEKTLSLEVYGYALDAQGRITDAFSATPALDLAKLGPSLERKGLQVLTVFKATEGTADLRFLVRHAASGRTASLRVLASPTGWTISPPLVMDDPGSRLVIPVASRANPELELPFRVGQRPFTPDLDPKLTNGEALEVCVMARPPRGPSLEVLADLRGADGKTRSVEPSGPVRLVKDKDGAFRIVLALKPSGVPAGDYALEVTLRDETGEEASSEQLVTVR